MLNPANLSKTFLLLFLLFLGLSFCQQMVLQSLYTALTVELHNTHSPGLWHALHCKKKGKDSLVYKLIKCLLKQVEFFWFLLAGNKKQSFFFRMSLGVFCIYPFGTCPLVPFFLHWIEPDYVFHCSCLLLLLRGCWWAQSGGFYCCGTRWVGWLIQKAQQAWMVGGIIDVSIRAALTSLFVR